MKMLIKGIPSGYVDAIRSGDPDANGQAAVVRAAEGAANPCRHCLELIAPGEEKLVLAYRPFDDPQPYAEVGPIFLHKRACTRYVADALPMWFNPCNRPLFAATGMTTGSGTKRARSSKAKNSPANAEKF